MTIFAKLFNPSGESGTSPVEATPTEATPVGVTPAEVTTAGATPTTFTPAAPSLGARVGGGAPIVEDLGSARKYNQQFGPLWNATPSGRIPYPYSPEAPPPGSSGIGSAIPIS